MSRRQRCIPPNGLAPASPAAAQVSKLERAKRPEAEVIYRPWGSCRRIDVGPRFQVERIPPSEAGRQSTVVGRGLHTGLRARDRRTGSGRRGRLLPAQPARGSTGADPRRCGATRCGARSARRWRSGAGAGRRSWPSSISTRPRRCLRPLRPLEVARGRRSVGLEAAEHLSLDVAIALHKSGPLAWTGDVTPERLIGGVAPARRFGRLRWALPLEIYGLLRLQPLSRGAHLGTTAVLWGGRGIGGMRVPDEPVRHRALDAIGDLSLIGHPMLAKITARHTGHDPDAATAAEVMAEPDACMIDPV